MLKLYFFEKLQLVSNTGKNTTCLLWVKNTTFAGLFAHFAREIGTFLGKLYLYLSCNLVVIITSTKVVLYSLSLLRERYKYKYNFFPIVEGLDNIARPAPQERPNACITAPSAPIMRQIWSLIFIGITFQN